MGPFLPLGPLPVLPLSLDCPFPIGPSVFSNAYLSCILYTQCYHCLWIVHSWLVLRFSLTLICPVSCVPSHNHCLWIVHSWLVLRFSLTLLCPVSCVPSVTIISGLSIPDCSFGFLWRLFVLYFVYSVLPLFLDCPFLISPPQLSINLPI